jgi:ABC-type nitrate/sulfonate/bicarbonate transport system permease component
MVRQSEQLRQNQSVELGSAGGRSRTTWFGVVGFLIIWLIVSSLQIVRPLILPSPVRVLEAAEDIGFTLVWHVLATTVRVIVGFVTGVLVGAFIGIMMQYSRKVFILLDGIIETVRPVPIVATIPFIILIFGFAEVGKFLVAVIGVAVIIVVSTIEAIERIPAGIVRWGLVSGLSKPEQFIRVFLPAAWPEMRAGFRISIALAVTLVVVAEFMGATYGLGYLISISKVTLSTPTMFLCIMIAGWLGWGLDKLVQVLFDKTCAWDLKAKGATR